MLQCIACSYSPHNVLACYQCSTLNPCMYVFTAIHVQSGVRMGVYTNNSVLATTWFASHNLCSHCLHFIRNIIQLAVQHSPLYIYYHYLGVCTNNFVFATNSFARHNLILSSHLPCTTVASIHCTATQ